MHYTFVGFYDAIRYPLNEGKKYLLAQKKCKAAHAFSFFALLVLITMETVTLQRL